MAEVGHQPKEEEEKKKEREEKKKKFKFVSKNFSREQFVFSTF